MATARQTALLVLYSIEFEGAYSNLALLDALKNSDLNKQDRAFVTGIVYGVVSMKRALDAVISKYSSVKPKKLSKYVLLILRMGEERWETGMRCGGALPELAKPTRLPRQGTHPPLAFIRYTPAGADFPPPRRAGHRSGGDRLYPPPRG